MKKTYLTKKRKAKIFMWKSITLLMAMSIGAGIIGHAGQLEAYQPDKYEPIAQLQLWPETDPIKTYVLKEIYKAGLNPDEAEAIINCESKWNADAHAINWNGKQGIDRGLWQINSLYHPEVSNECSYDYKCSTKEAIRIYKDRGNWSAWSCSKIALNK